MRIDGRGLVRLLAFAAIFAAAFGPLLQMQTVNAAQITTRSLTLQGIAPNGGSAPNVAANHIFTFTLPTGGTALGSIKFQYCTTASGTCTLPTGIVTTSATLGTTSGLTGFTINNTTNGSPYVTRAAATFTSGQAVTIPINSVTNPTAANSAFFVRISTYSSTDTTGSAVDTGTVTASTATPIVLTGTMPESLIFCTGGSVGLTGGIPDCTKATSGSISFNQLFSPTDTATATSQMAASTNAGSGYNVTITGATLTSGGNTIPAMTTAAASSKGIGQFGLNLKANTTATSTIAVGSEISPTSDGVNYRGQGLAGYNTVDTFKFNSGDSVANSAYTAAGPTNSQIYTASYIANVPGNQPAGTYQTTLTYICTATF